jgi:predicted transcriptional regulator of viral defense system
MNLEHRLDQLQKARRYSFERTEVLRELELCKSSLKKALQRATSRGRILTLRRDFYVLVPLEYSAVGAAPTEWFLDYLMTFVGRSLLCEWPPLCSSVARSGSPAFPGDAGGSYRINSETWTRARVRIRFLRNANMNHALIKPHCTQTGDIPVSTPEWTAIDLIRFQRQIGGMDTVATGLTELVDVLDPDQLVLAGERESTTAYLQRLGWMLDAVGGKTTGEGLHGLMLQRNPAFIPLNVGLDKRSGPPDSRWQVTVNEEPEADL